MSSDTAAGNGDKGYRRKESRAERLDRNFAELLQELRVTLAAVQILFGFLLSLAFQSRFEVLTSFQRELYIGTLISSALAVVFLTGGVAAHRVLFRRGVKDFVVRYTAAMAAIGLVLLALTVSGGLVLVIDVMVGPGLAFGIGVAVLAICAVVWLAIPGIYRWRTDDRDPGPRAE